MCLHSAVLGDVLDPANPDENLWSLVAVMNLVSGLVFRHMPHLERSKGKTELRSHVKVDLDNQHGWCLQEEM